MNNGSKDFFDFKFGKNEKITLTLQGKQLKIEKENVSKMIELKIKTPENLTYPFV